jgi:hypothetical protein
VVSVALVDAAPGVKSRRSPPTYRGAADFDAEEAELYSWVNRALPDAELDEFVARLAGASRRSPPMRCDRPSRCSTADSARPGRGPRRRPAVQQLRSSDTVKASPASLLPQGLQTRGPLELDLGVRIASL